MLTVKIIRYAYYGPEPILHSPHGAGKAWTMSAHLRSASSLPASLPARLRAARQAGWLAFMRRALRAIETRQHLAGLDDHMLRDIGLSHADACAEIRRAPWDIAAAGEARRRG
jgi:uncharacterized protein YjiS (DUF1127 family)